MHDSEFIAAHPDSIPSAARVVLTAMDGGGDVANAWHVLTAAIGHPDAEAAVKQAAGDRYGDNVMSQVRQALSEQHARAAQNAPTVRVLVTLAVRVDPQAWALAHGQGPDASAVRADVRAYVLNQVQQSIAAEECDLTAELY